VKARAGGGRPISFDANGLFRRAIVRKLLPFLPLGLSLAACVPARSRRRGKPAAYFALGTDPAGRWKSPRSPELRRRLLAIPGSPSPTPARGPVSTASAMSPRLTVDVTHTDCSDGMSDRRYRDRVTVGAADGKSVTRLRRRHSCADGACRQAGPSYPSAASASRRRRPHHAGVRGTTG
jgi:hypothetical protein